MKDESLKKLLGAEDEKINSKDTEEEDAARDILDAIKESDRSALSLALKRHYALCEDKAESEEEGY